MLILADYTLEIDLFQWLIQSCLLIVFFVIIQFSFVDAISKGVFKLTKRLMKKEKFINRYKLTFNYYNICIRSPLGELTHKWSKIEKVISTKNFLFLYIKERNGYIISISKKDYDCRKIEELLSFVEKNVITIIKV
ncbi:YcxB family protein [Flavobacterium chungbukense]|uniref:YcxB family protein n=2 Tax=Flavobacterium chungbukense TaxID=877464 RepID=UPI0039EE7EF8